MPTVSEHAQKLINNLERVGKLLGYEATKEASVFKGSTHRVDILWKGCPQINIPFPVPNIYSIEIQYSDAPTSIGFNIWKSEKTLHPAVHIVISYNKLSGDFRKLANAHYPFSGLAIFEGLEQIEILNKWMNNLIEERDKLKQTENATYFLRFLQENEIKLNDEMKRMNFELWLERMFEPVVYEIGVVSLLPDGIGTRTRKFLIPGRLDEAKKTALEYFEKTMNDDAPFERDGERVSLKRLEITCYEFVEHKEARPQINEGVVYKVVLNTNVGGVKQSRFEMTDYRFGKNAEEVTQYLIKDVESEIERMSSLPHDIVKQDIYFGTYSKVRSWKEAVKKEIILSSNEKPTKDQQIKIIRSFFLKEFGLGVEDFLSLNDISSTKEYYDNLDDIREELRELFQRYTKDFVDRMNGRQLLKFQQWLDNEC